MQVTDLMFVSVSVERPLYLHELHGQVQSMADETRRMHSSIIESLDTEERGRGVSAIRARVDPVCAAVRVVL